MVIATHKDRNHIHNHLVINSVSFQDGKKVHMTKKDLENLKKKNQLIQNNQVVPSIIKMEYYLIQPETLSRTEGRKSDLSFETRFTGNGRGTKTENIKNQVKNRSNSIIDRFITISNLFSNPQINNRPKRRIRRYRTLSKQAMKEYAIKQANSSGFDWFEDDELER